MPLKTPTFILGGKTVPFLGRKSPHFITKDHPLFGKKNNPTIEEHIESVVKGAIEETRVPPELIERAFVGNFAGELFCKQGILGAAVVGALPQLKYKPVIRLEAACASGGLAYAQAIEAIQAGSNIVLVVGVEVQNTVSARENGDFLARASHYRRQRQIDDFLFPALFAQRAKAYLEKFPQYSLEDLSEISVKAYSNGNKNPLAQMKEVKMDKATAASVDPKNTFLSDPELRPYMRNSDCSQISDGASALILASEEGLKILGRSAGEYVEVLSVAISTGDLYEDSDLTKLETVRHAAESAYRDAKIKPEDVQVAEVHDCFTIAELQMYEALGFAPYGKGLDAVKAGKFELTGQLPVNTGGGLISFGHPVGATGVKQVTEIFRQMKGLCGDYQMTKVPMYGVTANMGGADKTAVVSVLRNRTHSKL